MNFLKSRPSLLDTLAHAAVRRAVDAVAGAARREKTASGTLAVLVDATAGNGYDTCFLASCVRDMLEPRGSGGSADVPDVHHRPGGVPLCGRFSPAVSDAPGVRPTRTESSSFSGGDPGAQAVAVRWRVYALDVQEAAVAATESRLVELGLLNYAEVHLCGHERIDSVLPPDAVVAAALFNLGYLPGSDKKCITHAATTLTALNMLLPRLADGGCICVHYYTGHPGGQEEAEAVRQAVAALPPKLWRVVGSADANRENSGEGVFCIEKLPRRR